jgi:hypothetical protein
MHENIVFTFLFGCRVHSRKNSVLEQSKKKYMVAGWNFKRGKKGLFRFGGQPYMVMFL